MDDSEDKGRGGDRPNGRPKGRSGDGPRKDGRPGARKGGKFEQRPAPGPGQRRFDKPRTDSRGEEPRRFKDFKKKPFDRPEGGERKPSARPGRAERDAVRGERTGEPAGNRLDRSERSFKPRPGEPRPEGQGEKRPFRPRPEGAGKPSVGGKPSFSDKPRFRGGGDRPRDGDGPLPPRDKSERPFKPRREGEGEKRAFHPRPEGGGKPSFGSKPSFADKPRFRDRDDRPREARRPATFGAVQQEGEAGEERIAKRLARAGIASRRDAEDLIAAGRVKVNGKVLASPAFNVQASDRIEVDDTEIPAVERTRLFLFHKPSGVVTTNRDPEGRRTVFDVLPGDLPRLITVGRLDINTEGLLLLTNDGGLSRVLELPSTGWLRRYRVRVHGQPDEKALAGLKDGIAVDGVFYGSIEATVEREQGSNAWLSIGLREGKNREVKNVLGALGLEVTRLIRVSFGPFQLGDLAEGAVLEIKGKMLRDQLGPRLIEESGANFEAPVAKPFSNAPVLRGEARRGEARRGDERPEREDRDERPRRERRPEPVGEGGLIKRRHARESVRDDALARLDTRPGRGGPKGFGKSPGKAGPGKFGPKPAFGGKRDAEDGKPQGPKGPRKANVWMAPGARPKGKKPDAAKPRPPRKDGDRPGPRGKGGNADRRR